MSTILKVIENLRHPTVVPHLPVDASLESSVPLSVVADACRIGGFQISNISPFPVPMFHLCDKMGFPVMRLAYARGTWRLSFTNSEGIKERGKDRNTLETQNNKYLLTALKKLVNSGDFAGKGYRHVRLLSFISRSMNTALVAATSGQQVQHYVSLDAKAFHDLYSAFRGDAPASSISPGAIAALDAAFKTASDNLNVAASTEKVYQDNFYTKTFYAIYVINGVGVTVCKVGVDPSMSSRAHFIGATNMGRLVQMGGFQTYPNLAAMYAAQPDLEFQLTMMRQARAHSSLHIPAPNLVDVLNEAHVTQYDRELNIIRNHKGGEYNLPIGMLTMVEAV